MTRPGWRYTPVVTLIGLAAVYVLAGKLGLSLAFVNEHATSVWPPTGIAIASCLVLGTRVWPALFAGAFLVNYTTSQAPLVAAAIAAGNTLEGVAGAALVARFAGGCHAFESARDTLRFALLAGICATVVSASIGAATLAIAGLAAPHDIAAVFVTWWIGDMVGAMLVAPPLVLFRPARTSSARLTLEAVFLAGTLAAVSVFVFGPSPAGVRRLPLEFLTIAVLLWAAFRFGAFVTSTSAAAMCAIAVWGTLHGYGPFAGSSPNASLLVLQAFVGVVSIMTLAVAAEVAARRSASRSLSMLADSLEGRVAARTEELAAMRDRLAEAQEVAHVGSWEWDVARDSLWWSDELYRIYGVGKEAGASYETFLSHVHADDRERVHAVVRRALVDGQPFAFEHRIVRGDGAIRTLSARGRVTPDASGVPVRMSGVGHDITELKHAEEERAQFIHEQAARREAEAASRAKDQFLATLSHELRTPMNAVLGWAHMLRELPASDERRARAADVIFRNVQIQAQLVSDMFDVSRITAGALSLDVGIVSLGGVIDDAVEIVRDAAAAKQVKIDVRRPRAPMDLPGDGTRLRQVVWNLLANAVKFVGHGGRVSLAAVPHLEAFEIVVEDDGPGIAPEFLPHAFDRCRQADGSLTRAHGGLGLGLAIVRHIVELHGGTVTAANRVPHGAQLTVRLPRAGAAARRADSAETVPAPEWRRA